MLSRKLLAVIALLIAQSSAYVKYRRKNNVNKTPLFAAYPQLWASSTNACTRAVNEMIINMYTVEKYEKMVAASMHGLDDLGSEYLCTAEGMD